MLFRGWLFQMLMPLFHKPKGIDPFGPVPQLGHQLLIRPERPPPPSIERVQRAYGQKLPQLFHRHAQPHPPTKYYILLLRVLDTPPDFPRFDDGGVDDFLPASSDLAVGVDF
jgi:hypothetical protein